MRTNILHRIPRAHAALLSLALALGLLACAAGSGSRASWEPVAPQQWQRERGPVVPHDSFPSDCALCHEGSSWHEIRDDFAFDHARETGVALVGAHERAECLRCHNDRGPVGAYAQRGCVGCHEDVHEGKLGDACTVCHDESAIDWRPKGAIAEHARTRFPLVGAHASTACFACHAGAQVGNFAHASTRCVDCHADDLARATEPDHVAQGWTDSCQRCHLPTAWSGAGFEHGFFALQGGHADLACNACHVGGGFRGLSSACFACHDDDYASARDHASQNFPTDCAQCHTISGWEGARFSHAGIASGCVNCHADDYAATTQPNHASSGFGTSCQTCHTTRTWGDGSFDHPQFPISGGDHGGLTCQQCHPVPSNFAQFTCTSCHAHSSREMNDEHDRVRGYSFQSSACYSCHPDGRED